MPRETGLSFGLLDPLANIRQAVFFLRSGGILLLLGQWQVRRLKRFSNMATTAIKYHY